jgi:hypothetical protein
MANIDAKSREALAFDELARRIVRLDDIGLIRDHLRLIWNTRGVADIATVESQLFKIMKPADVGRHLTLIDHAIRALDRT